jgi:hypothetical protein
VSGLDYPDLKSLPGQIIIIIIIIIIIVFHKNYRAALGTFGRLPNGYPVLSRVGNTVRACI